MRDAEEQQDAGEAIYRYFAHTPELQCIRLILRSESLPVAQQPLILFYPNAEICASLQQLGYEIKAGIKYTGATSCHPVGGPHACSGHYEFVGPEHEKSMTIAFYMPRRKLQSAVDSPRSSSPDLTQRVNASGIKPTKTTSSTIC